MSKFRVRLGLRLDLFLRFGGERFFRDEEWSVCFDRFLVVFLGLAGALWGWD